MPVGNHAGRQAILFDFMIFHIIVAFQIRVPFHISGILYYSGILNRAFHIIVTFWIKVAFQFAAFHIIVAFQTASAAYYILFLWVLSCTIISVMHADIISHKHYRLV